jgi:hypothetical protein
MLYLGTNYILIDGAELTRFIIIQEISYTFSAKGFGGWFFLPTDVDRHSDSSIATFLVIFFPCIHTHTVYMAFQLAKKDG